MFRNTPPVILAKDLAAFAASVYGGRIVAALWAALNRNGLNAKRNFIKIKNAGIFPRRF